MNTLLVLTLLSLYLLLTPNLIEGESSISGEGDSTESNPEPISFTFAGFTNIDRNRLKFVFDAEPQNISTGIELTPFHAALPNVTVDGDQMGKVFYKDSVQMKAKTADSTVVSFSTSFTFVIQRKNQSNAGDGLAFVLAADPNFQGDEGGQFGIFKAGSLQATTVAVEFDTFKNDNLMDMDANHVGVDINNALSLLNASASAVNIDLRDIRPVTAWIDYDADQKEMEIRISDDSTKPPEPLIKGPLDLSSILASKMWVGFSASTHVLAHQSHKITYWTFECETVHEEELSLLERLKRFWRTSPSYGVVAAAAAVVVLIIVSVICCCCGCPCCRKCCPCFACGCCCCPRCCPCTHFNKNHEREEQYDRRCTCSNRQCSCDSCRRGSRTSIDLDRRKEKKKPCPLAFLELIQEDVSEEKDIDFTLPESIRSFLPVKNPFSTEQVTEPGCMSSILFGADPDDDSEIGAQMPKPGEPLPRGNMMMVSNTVFDAPEETCHCPEHCPLAGKTSSSTDCLVGENCLIESSSVEHQQKPECPPPQAPPRRKSSGGEVSSRETESGATYEEETAMGWGFFSP